MQQIWHQVLLGAKTDVGGCDCGLFAITNAFTVALSCNPTDAKYDQSQMRQHVLHCISENVIDPFP